MTTIPSISPRLLLSGLCAVFCFTACGGASRGVAPPTSTTPAASPDSLTGFARDDRQAELDREDQFRSAISAISVRATLDAAADAPWLLAEFTAAGLDAGLWTSEGTHTMARLEGSDATGQVILLAAAGSDPSGVAGLLEVARGLGALARTGWQPRRTMVLAVWDGDRPARKSARAWMETGPMEAASTTMAMLAVDGGLSGDAFRIAATPDLRVLAARLLPRDVTIASPDGRGAAGVFLAAGISTLEIARSSGTMSRRRRASANPGDILAGARLWGTLALRLSEAALPPHNLAVTAQRTLMGLRRIEDAAGAAFGGNPPPSRDLRVAILRLRHAAEAWNNTAGALLAARDTISRGPEPDGERAALEAAGRLALAAGRMLGPGGHEEGVCRSVLYCPATGKDRPAILLPGLAQAVAREDRTGYVTEILALAMVVRQAGQRLAEATDLLPRSTGETP
ncbi:MAG: hypothetical protein E2P03_06450 [Acidobacteria bacterium]|nr:MAG: hypothetical protein E2P03_06450 [Acidobacteriota bacterium]